MLIHWMWKGADCFKLSYYKNFLKDGCCLVEQLQPYYYCYVNLPQEGSIHL